MCIKYRVVLSVFKQDLSQVNFNIFKSRKTT